MERVLGKYSSKFCEVLGNPCAVFSCLWLADGVVCNEGGRIHWARKDAERRGPFLWLPVSPALIHVDISVLCLTACTRCFRTVSFEFRAKLKAHFTVAFVCSYTCHNCCCGLSVCVCVTTLITQIQILFCLKFVYARTHI